MKHEHLIKEYYDNFNQGKMTEFINLLHDDVQHDINQGERQVGKDKFIQFMERMNRCYHEQVKNLKIMTNDAHNSAAAEFTIVGTYLHSDKGLPEAKGQRYEINCGAFFEIKDGKIYRITNYYNLNDWINQVKST